MQEQHEYSLVDEFPKCIESYALRCRTTVTGSVIMDSIYLTAPFRDIEHALDYFVKTQSETTFVTIGCGLPAYSMGLFHQEPTGMFYVFDPHSRDNGMSCQDGKAVLTCHKTVNVLKSFFNNLAEYTGQGENVQFERVPYIVTPNTCSDESQTEILGFNSTVTEDKTLKKRKQVQKERQKRNQINNIPQYDCDPLEDYIPVTKLVKLK